jgi:cytochrome oxidase Cu insertion factor (SCO1/SenC/PrrC family)
MRSALEGPKSFLRFRGRPGRLPPLWQWLLAALAFGVVLGAGIAFLNGSRQGAPPVSMLPGRPAASWAAGKERAPDFRLTDGQGAPISLDRFRGRPVIVTFVDPVCRTLCPLEAKELNLAVEEAPRADRPAIVAVSVDPWADSRANFRRDRRKWRLVPAWHWGVGRYAQLARVWHSYKIGVLDRKTVVGGITVHDVSHTEASFVIDRKGYERALFLFPFSGGDVAAELRGL